ncbi:hypothetical protein P3T76_002136 [Phytophthora citrophthora]|uniref:Uncharacterized protein n=1 Tax=Phytophthora citrophthora TaxID=4793 RepID=A0AAD9LTV3_9STRA|nr:hypothetical protein P3T76_002136 [Phytophthora citrophthora]
MTNRWRRTPLQSSSWNELAEVYEEFTDALEAGRLRARNDVIATGQLEILKLLLEKDSGHEQEEYDMGYATDDRNGVRWGGNDMALAVKNGHSDVVHWLLEHTRNTRRVRDDVFIQAALAGNLPIVKFLLYHGFPVTESLRPATF